jgi:hypothetical protein
MRARYFLLGTFIVPSLALSSASPEKLPSEKARRVLQHHCGSCHDPAQGSVNTKALRVYDLSRVNWASTLNNKQLKQLPQRLLNRGLLTPEEREAMSAPGTKSLAPPTSDEIRFVESYIEQEVKTRSLNLPTIRE